jgi:hypothetical protein
MQAQSPGRYSSEIAQPPPLRAGTSPAEVRTNARAVVQVRPRRANGETVEGKRGQERPVVTVGEKGDHGGAATDNAMCRSAVSRLPRIGALTSHALDSACEYVVVHARRRPGLRGNRICAGRKYSWLGAGHLGGCGTSSHPNAARGIWMLIPRAWLCRVAVGWRVLVQVSAA